MWAKGVKVGRVGVYEMGAKKVFGERDVHDEAGERVGGQGMGTESIGTEKERVLVREEYREVFGIDFGSE